MTAPLSCRVGMAPCLRANIYPPSGFVITLGDTPPPRAEFLDISGFAQFAYRDWRAGISMKLPLMSIYTAFPGDYRTRAQTLADLAANKAYEAGLRP